MGILEAQAKLREAEELMQSALNVRESELGLSKFASTEYRDESSVQPHQRNMIESTCGGGHIAGCLHPISDLLNEDGRIIWNTRYAVPVKSSGSPCNSGDPLHINRQPLHIDTEGDRQDTSGLLDSPEVRSLWSDDDEWNRKEP